MLLNIAGQMLAHNAHADEVFLSCKGTQSFDDRPEIQKTITVVIHLDQKSYPILEVDGKKFYNSELKNDDFNVSANLDICDTQFYGKSFTIFKDKEKGEWKNELHLFTLDRLTGDLKYDYQVEIPNQRSFKEFSSENFKGKCSFAQRKF